LNDASGGAPGATPVTRVAPFGSWESPFPIEMVTKGAVTLGEVNAREGIRWWLEGRPDEAGRQVLVRRDADGSTTRLSPEGFNVRSRVHEYGGGAYAVDGDLVVVSDFTTGRLHCVTSPGVTEAFTPERAWRYADLSIDRARNRVLAVREDHEPETIERHGEAENTLVGVDLASGVSTILASGTDFVSAPRLSPDGHRLAWLRWNHPNMPWDGTELVVADLDADGRPGEPTVVAGSATDWIAQPRWSPRGVLHFVAEPAGWMNLWRVGDDGRVQPVLETEAEFAFPDWNFGYSNYAFEADGGIVAIGRSRGRDRIYRIGADGGPAEEIPLDFTEMSYVGVDDGTVVFRAASPSRGWGVFELDLVSKELRTLREGSSERVDPADVSIARHVEFPTTGGRTAFGLFYPPHNRSFRGPDGERPPLIVTSHGGPTAEASTAFQVGVQLFTSRGFGVLDVDYGGSTGYGQAYRKRLEGQWGVVDVDDCVNGAAWLVEEGLVDGERLAIRGGSASGYTTLAAVTFRDQFKAGTSYFGIGDLETFDAQTHKFESRYTWSLVGRYPEARALYRARSPLNFPERISCPVLILQGAEDRIVPPAQAEQIVDALWERRLPHAYLLFPGEDHGFRTAANIIRSFEAELSFYGQVFGFEPAGSIEPIEVKFLGSAGAHALANPSSGSEAGSRA
jgi:dipeptidyl aminopeptidase/acylaminoacyl peptidase